MTAKSTQPSAETWVSAYEGAPTKWAPTGVGDHLIGVYRGPVVVDIINEKGENEPITYYDIMDDAGTLWSLPGSYQIVKGFASVVVGARVRVTFLGEIDLGKKGHNPMKNYSIDVAA